MPDKAPKAKAKPKADAPSLLGALPSTRPERIGAPRGRAPKRAATPRRGAEPAPKRVAKKRAAKPAAARNGAAAKPVRAVRPGSPPLGDRPTTNALPPKPLGAPKGTELVTTAIRATGELAQIGFTVGGQMLKRAVDRIPRP